MGLNAPFLGFYNFKVLQSGFEPDWLTFSHFKTSIKNVLGKRWKQLKKLRFLICYYES